MDEPLANLDSLTRLAMQDGLLALWQRERFTAFLVTHDVEEALYLTGRVLVLSQRPARVLADIKMIYRIRGIAAASNLWNCVAVCWRRLDCRCTGEANAGHEEAPGSGLCDRYGAAPTSFSRLHARQQHAASTACLALRRYSSVGL